MREKKNNKAFLFLFVLGFIVLTPKLSAQKHKISSQEINLLSPLLQEWLIFYDLNLSDFESDKDCSKPDMFFNQEQKEDTLSIYYQKFEDALDDIYDPIICTYSPNRMRYLNLPSSLGVGFKEADSTYYYYGGDDCQEIYLTDRDKKVILLEKWNGTGHITEDAWWINDDCYVLVTKSFDESCFVIDICDLNKLKYTRYKSNSSSNMDKSYFDDVVLKKRNIKDYF